MERFLSPICKSCESCLSFLEKIFITHNNAFMIWVLRLTKLENLPIWNNASWNHSCLSCLLLMKHTLVVGLSHQFSDSCKRCIWAYFPFLLIMVCLKMVCVSLLFSQCFLLQIILSLILVFTHIGNDIYLNKEVIFFFLLLLRHAVHKVKTDIALPLGNISTQNFIINSVPHAVPGTLGHSVNSWMNDGKTIEVCGL